MKTALVYLSSTDFQLQPDCDWKKNVSRYCDYFIRSHNYDYQFRFHDPLQNISDKAEIVSDDISNILASDFVICYLPESKLTIGTLMELQYSCLNKKKDNIIVIDRYKIHRKHPWIKFWIKHVVDNECEAALIMMNIMGNGSFNNLKESF